VTREEAIQLRKYYMQEARYCREKEKQTADPIWGILVKINIDIARTFSRTTKQLKSERS